jgi:hypothetical protein
MSVPSLPFLTQIQLGIDSSTDNQSRANHDAYFEVDPKYDENVVSADMNHLSDDRKSYYLTLKKFSGDESATITKGLKNTPWLGNSDPNKNFIFTKQGNIKCFANGSHHVFLNPFRPKKIGTISTDGWTDEEWFNNSRSLPAIRGSGGSSLSSNQGHFVWDLNNVISEGLLYILANKNGIWHLLYNPMHRQEFKDYYKSWYYSRSSTDSDGRAHGTNTGYTSVTGKDVNGNQWIPFKKLFHKYCNGFKVAKNTWATPDRFLDPTCNMFYEKDNCGYSVFFRENRSSYDVSKVPGFDAIKPQVEEFMNATAANPPPCVCQGTTSEMVDDLTDENSFATIFHGRDGSASAAESCPLIPRQINMCNVNIQAQGDMLLEGSTVGNTCGGGSANVPPLAPNNWDEAPPPGHEQPTTSPTDEVQKNDRLIAIAITATAVTLVGAGGFFAYKKFIKNKS